MLGGHFPIRDLLTADECRELGLTTNGFRYRKGRELVEVRAVATGERRAPEAGEWYLSGAIVEAYRTKHALPMGCVYPIARLVVMRRVERWEVITA